MDLKSSADQLSHTLRLETSPVGVFLLGAAGEAGPFGDWTTLEAHRYCQALMRARRGERVLLEEKGLSCPAAARAFGFRPLPQALACGEGLVGFGIVGNPGTGRTMFQWMPHLDAGAIRAIAAAPLAAAPRLPDVVVIEGTPEQLMWIVLAEVNLTGGTRSCGSSAVLQATCVDSTIIPFLEKRLNFSLGCYGCREATDMAPSETVLGFPGEMLDGILGEVTRLSEKAMPNSRRKRVFHRLAERAEDRCEAVS